MNKKMIRLLLVLIAAIIISTSVSNIAPKSTEAAMESKNLIIYYFPDFMVINCFGTGEGCYIVTPDPEPDSTPEN